MYRNASAWRGVVVLVLALVCAPAAHAVTWISTSGGSWGDVAKWDAAVPDAQDALASFSGEFTGDITITLDANRTVGSLLFNDTTPSNNWTINAGTPATSTLTLLTSSGGPTIEVDNQTATLGAIVAGTQGFTKTGAGVLVLGNAGNTLSGSIAVNAGELRIAAVGALGDAANGITLDGGALRTTASLDLGAGHTVAIGASGGTLSAATATTLTVSGVVSGSGTLTAAGGGAIVLSAANPGFTGSVTVDSVAGNTTNTTLRLSNAAALNSGTIITVNPGLAVAAGNGNQVDLANVSIGAGMNIVLNAVNTGNFRSTLLASTGTSTWLGGVQFNGDGAVALNSGATLNIDGNITAGGSGYTGNAFIRGTGTGVINGTINLPGGSIMKTDGGTWTINTTGNTWLNTVVAVGTLKLGAANALPQTTPLTMGQNDPNAATLDLNGFSQSIGSLASNPTTGANALNKTITSATAATFTINTTGNTSYAGAITGAMSIVKDGPGTQVLSGTNTYTGNTTVNAGMLVVGKPGSLPGYDAAGRVTINNAGSTLAVQVGGAGQWTAADIDTLLGVTSFPAGANLGFDATAGTFTYGSVLTGSKGLVKLGAAAVSLTGANNYAGGTTINNGLLIAENNTALGTGNVTIAVAGGRIGLGSGVTVANNLVIEQAAPGAGLGVIQGPATGTATYSGSITINANQTNGGHIAGGSGLVLSGPIVLGGAASNLTIRAGAVTLNNAASSYPALEISAGATTLGVANAIPAAATVAIATVANETGLLDLNGFNQTVATLTFGAGTGTVNTGAGTLTLTGDVTSSGNSTHTINGNLNLGGARNFYVADSTTNNRELVVNAVVSNGSLAKWDNGTLDLTAANTFTGGTTINSGAIRVGHNAALGAGPLAISYGGLASTSAAAYTLTNALTLNGDVTFGQTAGGSGDLTLTNSVDLVGGTRYFTVNNTTTLTGAVRTGGIVKQGPGTLNLTGNNTATPLTGDINITAGTLHAASANAIKGVGGLMINSGAIFSFGSGANTTLTPTSMSMYGGVVQFGLGTNYDKIDLGSSSWPGLSGTLRGFALPGHGVGSNYALISAAGGLSGLTLGYVPPGYTYTLNASGAQAILQTTGLAPTGPYYWRGDNFNNPTSWAFLGMGDDSNWATTVDGSVDPQALPGPATDVYFSNTNAGGSAISTTLDGPFSINSLKFIPTTPATGAVTIAAGLGGSLTIGAGGLELQRGAALPNISAPIILGADQRWSINNAATNVGLIVTGPLSGSGTLSKVGNARLELNNQTSLVASTNTGNIYFNEGEFLLRIAAMGAADGPVLNPAGSGDIYLSAPGGTFYLRYDGDNNATFRNYSFANNLVVNRPVTVNLDRSTGGSDKNSVFPSLTINDTQLTIAQNNNFRLAISGNINLVGNAVINAGDLTNMASGKITDNGKGLTFNKVGGSTFNVLGTGNDFSGGFVATGGNTRVGDGYGTTVTNPTATLGTGPIVVNPGARVRFLTGTNVAPGQTIDVVSNVNGAPAVEIGDNTFPSGLRTLGTGVFQVFAGSFNRSIDLSRLGDGTWRLGSSATSGSATITGGTLLPGAGNLYRLGGGGNTLTVSAADYLSGTAGLHVGGQFTNGGTYGGASTVVLTASNTFSGPTTINRGSTLRFQRGGTSGGSTTASSLGTTSGIELYGTITAESSGSNHGTFFNSAGAVIPVTLYGGARLFLDNAGITTAGLNVNRWGDSAPIAMNQLDFELRSRNYTAAADVTLEDVGPITVQGGNILRVTRNQLVANITATLRADSVSRVSGSAGTLELVRSTGTGAGAFGATQKFIVDAAPTATNGMTTPWIVIHSDKTHVTYDATNGFVPVTYVTAENPAVTNELLNTGALNLTSDITVWALKQTGALTTSSGNVIQIGSGGLIADASVTNTAGLRFFDTASVEAQIFVDDDNTLVQTGTIGAAGLTKFGAGILTITANNNILLTGDVYVNRGTLQLEHASALGGRPVYVTAGGTLNLRQAAATTFTSGVTLTPDSPIGNVSVGRTGTTADNLTLTIPTLTLSGSGGALGQTFNFTGGNNFDLLVSGATTVTGNATFHANSGGSDLFLDGGLVSNTAGAVITKSGGQQLRVQGSGSAAAGTQFVVNGGSLTLRDVTSGSTDAAFTPLGAGANTTIVMNTGTLNLRTENKSGTFGGTSATAGGYNLVVNGDTTINVDRTASTGSGKRLRLGGLTIGSQTLSVSGGNGYQFAFTGPVVMNGDPTFNTTSDIPEFYGRVSGGRLIKTGTSSLRLTAGDNVNSFDGGALVQQGWLVGANNRGLGTGNIVVNPGGGVAMYKPGTLQIGQMISLRSGVSGLAMVGMNYGAAVAPSALLPNLDLSHASTGLFGGGANYNVSLDLGDLFGPTVANDDNWYLGAISWNDTYYTADSLTPGAGNTYRLGGGGGNMQINRNTKTPNTGIVSDAATGNNVLTGTASVTIGLPAHNILSHQASTVVIAGTQDYTGGTLVNRGMSLSLASAATAANSGAGTGNIDLYGTLVLRTRGTLTNGAGGNVNTVTTHPGARILLNSDDAGVGMAKVSLSDRWGDSAPIVLNGARFDVAGYNQTGDVIDERIGAVTFERGAQLRVDRNGTNSRTYLSVAGLTRSASGTLMLLQGDGVLPDGTTADNFERFIVTGTAPTVTNGMAAPWFIDATDHRFVTYDSTTTTDGKQIGFRQTNWTSGVDINGAAAGTEIIGMANATTLTTNPTLWALKVANSLSASADGQFKTVTVRSGGFIGQGGTTTANLVFNDGSSDVEALMYLGGNTILQGTVTATQITKFGFSELQLDRATPVFNGPLVINNGAVRALQLGALTTGPITLNGGGGATGDDNSGTGLFFAANIASGEEQVYTHGDVTSWDNSRVLFITGGSDRTQRAGNFILESTAGASGMSVLQLRTENSRQRIGLGNVTFNSAQAVLQVLNNSFTGGASSVVAPKALIGDSKNVTKLGSGVLELGGLTSTLTNSTLTIGQGALRVVDGASLGTNNNIVIDIGAALEIATSNFALAGATTLTQNWGSGERWNVEDARGLGNYTVPNGVNLQLNTNLLSNTPRTITLDGGALEGFLYTDALAKAVTRTVGSAVTINLASDSYIGQNLYVGQYGSDAGLQGSFPDRNPVTGDVRGAILVVNGAITGADKDLTKIGRDMVVLAGTNTYRNTIVEQGFLRLGKTDTLPTTGILTTRFDGTVDMNGFNQTVVNLGVKDGDPQSGVGVGYSGLMTNSAYDFSTLTLGNADNYTYNGDIAAAISLVKQGTGETKLGGNLSYLGTTTVNAGVLYLAGTAPPALHTASTVVANDAGIVLPVGGAGRLDAAGVDTFRTTATLGTNLSIGFDVADTFSYTYTTLFPTATGLIKGGLGTLVLPTATTWSKGASLRGGTTEFAAGALGATTPIELRNSNTIRWSSGNTEDISARLSALPANATTTFDVDGNTVAFATGLTGAATANLAKVGSGTLTLTGASTYGGTTNVVAGTLAVGVENALPGATALSLGDGGANYGTLSLNSNQTLGSVAALAPVTNTTLSDSITVAAGRTLTVANAGAGNVVVANEGANLVVSGGGAMNVDAPAGIIHLPGARSGSVYFGLDASGLSSFTANVATVNVGYDTNNIGRLGLLTLATGTNSITANNVLVGFSSLGGGVAGRLTLGAANTLNVGSLEIGIHKANGTVQFATGLTNPTLTIRGTAGGASRANLMLGRFQNAGSGTNPTGTLDLTVAGRTGAIDAMFDTVTLGSMEVNGNSTNNGSTGNFAFHAGSVDINTLIVAETTAAATQGKTQGTFSMGGGTLVVNTAFALAKRGEANATQSAIGVVNLTGGAATVNCDITTVAAGTSTITLNGGSLDMTGHAIGTAADPIDTLNFQAGTLKNVAEINGGAAGVTKTTAGTLLLEGTNTYTGPTTVQGGTLGASGALASAVTVGDGLTLSGTLTPGDNGTVGTVAIANALTFTTTANALFDIAALASFDKVTGVTALTYGGTLTVQGAVPGGTNNFDLFDFATQSGAFGGFVMPSNVTSYAFEPTTGVLTMTATALGPTTRIWNGGAGDDLWTSGANWGGTAPATGDIVAFSGSTRLTPNNNTSLTVGGVTFASGATGQFVLGGNALTVAGKIDVEAGAVSPQKIDVPVTLVTAAVDAGVVNVATTGQTLEITKPVSGAVGLKKTGDGTLRLSSTAQPNDYTGNTVVEAGTLRVDGGINLNAATDDTIVATGTPGTTATLITDHVRQDTLTINADGKVQITGTTTSVVNFLQIANGAGGFSWDAGSGGAAPAGATSGSGVSAVPEPATWLLTVIAAIAGLLAWRRRR